MVSAGKEIAFDDREMASDGKEIVIDGKEITFDSKEICYSRKEIAPEVTLIPVHKEKLEAKAAIQAF